MHLLQFGDRTNLCRDGYSKKVGDLLLGSASITLLVSCLCTIHVCKQLKKLQFHQAPIRIKISKPKSKEYGEDEAVSTDTNLPGPKPNLNEGFIESPAEESLKRVDSRVNLAEKNQKRSGKRHSKRKGIRE